MTEAELQAIEMRRPFATGDDIRALIDAVRELTRERDDALAKLAESQAREAALRVQLDEAKRRIRRAREKTLYDGYDRAETNAMLETQIERIDAALATPADDTALREHDARVAAAAARAHLDEAARWFETHDFADCECHAFWRMGGGEVAKILRGSDFKPRALASKPDENGAKP